MIITTVGGQKILRKMDIKEILVVEQQNTQIILHKRDLFWRAYEKSAFLFVRNIKEFQIIKKSFYKNMIQNVVYLVDNQIYADSLKTNSKIAFCSKISLSIQQIWRPFIRIFGNT